MVERDCCWGEDGSRREGQAGFWDASARPGAGFCSLLSSPLPLQQLWLAWRVFKLIQLSGGLFLVQSALDLAAVQRALLSCCPECCWFGEARASPWLCPRSHPLLHPAHRTIGALLLCLPCRTIFIPLSMHDYWRAHWRAHCCCRRTPASLWAAAASPAAFCPTRAGRRSNGCLSRERRDGGNHALQCPVPKDRGARATAKARRGRRSSDEIRARQPKATLCHSWQGLAEARLGLLPSRGSQENTCTQHPSRVGK